MQGLLDFFAANKDGLTIALQILGIVGGVLVAYWGAWKLIIERLWKQHVRIDIQAFEVITDATKLLPKLLRSENNDDPLADHNIEYQERDPERDTQIELKTALNKKRYLLVTAPSGYGKTREGGMLAESLMRAGYRVVQIHDDWLEIPKNLPKELEGNRNKILIFLDDLNGLFRAGKDIQSPRAQDIPLLSQKPYHDRLVEVLGWFEARCGQDEIRVIATARSDDWDVLDFDQNDNLWKRFTRVELSEPKITSVINLLDQASKSAGLKANKDDFEAIAHKNDGTYRNIVLNLQKFQAENSEVTKENYSAAQGGSWREFYERICSDRPAIQYLYAAIELARQARINLYTFAIEPIALLLWAGNPFQRLIRQREIHNTLHYLTDEIKKLPKTGDELAPHDGQIEVWDEPIHWQPFAEGLEKLLLRLSKTHTEKMNDSLFGFGAAAYYEKQFQRSERMWEKLLEIMPNTFSVSSNLGVVLSELKRYDEAEAAYRTAIELNPSYAGAYSNLGFLLNNLKRYEEAEAAYRTAIELDPSDAGTYNNLGSLLDDLKRYEESEAAYRTAIELDPSHASACYNLGNLLKTLKRYDEAEAAYRTAIELDPSDASVYNNLGSLLDDLKRYDEAEAAYRTAIELDPSYASAYSNLGILLKTLKRHEEAEAAYRTAIELDPPDAGAYN